MHAVAELVAGLGRGGVEHVCLNKTGLEDVPGGLELLLAALQRADPASADVAPSDEEQWPLLELSEVRVPPCACGGRPPTVCCTFDWRGGVGAGGRGGGGRCRRNIACSWLRWQRRRKPRNRGATEVQQRCNRGATEVQQRCNRGATAVQQRCNRGATEVQQRCNSGATEVQLRCNRCATAVQQRCNRGATEMQQRCNSWFDRDATEVQRR
jgi:hypothetical protein